MGRGYILGDQALSRDLCWTGSKGIPASSVSSCLLLWAQFSGLSEPCSAAHIWTQALSKGIEYRIGMSEYGDLGLSGFPLPCWTWSHPLSIPLSPPPPQASLSTSSSISLLTAHDLHPLSTRLLFAFSPFPSLCVHVSLLLPCLPSSSLLLCQHSFSCPLSVIRLCPALSGAYSVSLPLPTALVPSLPTLRQLWKCSPLPVMGTSAQSPL